jgi:hypothetical protein
MLGIFEGTGLKTAGCWWWWFVAPMSVRSCCIILCKGCHGEMVLWQFWKTLYSRLLTRAGFQVPRKQVPVWMDYQASDLENGLKYLEKALFFTTPHSFVPGTGN